MKTISLEMDKRVDYASAERAAKEALMSGAGVGKPVMVAWYDRPRDLASPGETCSKEGWKGARDYAEHHGADCRVSVNEDDYEFYFTNLSFDFEELDREESLSAHADASRADFDDLQGG